MAESALSVVVDREAGRSQLAAPRVSALWHDKDDVGGVPMTSGQHESAPVKPNPVSGTRVPARQTGEPRFMKYLVHLSLKRLSSLTVGKDGELVQVLAHSWPWYVSTLACVSTVLLGM
jgi:hypothetical protein